MKWHMLYLVMKTPPHTATPWPDLKLRPASPADLPALAEFLTAAHPDQPRTAADLERLDSARLPGEAFHRNLAIQQEQIVGLSEVAVPLMDGHPGWLMVTVHTLPALAESPLVQDLLSLAERNAGEAGASTLLARVKETWWEKPYLEARGYREFDRMWYSTLDLTELNFQKFRADEERAFLAGITIRPLSELGELDEVQQRRLYTLIAALLRDVPSTAPSSVWPFEVWQHRFLSHFKHPEGLFVAIAPDGAWVGLTELHTPNAARPGTLNNGLTGVLADWRGHRVGLALKLAAARAALARGFTHARTGNHAINRPMLAINEALGFVKEAAMVTLVKER